MFRRISTLRRARHFSPLFFLCLFICVYNVCKDRSRAEWQERRYSKRCTVLPI
jgi:hypothetical protein